MKKYMHIEEYCTATGFPIAVMRRLTRSNRAAEFSFRSSSAELAPINIIVPVFERLLEQGELKDIIEA